MKRTLAALLGALVLIVVTVEGVQAHAAPAKVTPGDGAVLTAPPAKVVIEMSQDMARQAGGNDIDVLGPDGGEVTTEAASVDNSNRRVLSVNLPTGLPAGKYVVKWKSLSADDGDPANGELSFTVDPAGPPQPGKEVLREELGSSPTQPPNAGSARTIPAVKEPDGVTWVLVIAVGLGALVLGAGGTFLLVDKRSSPAAPRKEETRK